ncbi:MAG: ARMT1-like domain-containing protein [Kiritimatiellia bacterium]|nr:ARMT1-like domain-containing protein [Kiritimatiellia bacterium]
MQRVIRQGTNGTDPYQTMKNRMNQMALNLLPALVRDAQNQPDPREAVVRLAIAGNLLDAGSKSRLELDDLPAVMQTLWTGPFSGCVADLFRAAEEAHCILYLADNAGEIIFDRLLIEALPAEKITVAVRGGPVLNDATLEDAEAAGIPEISPVMDNGSDAPGTVLSDCSTEFCEWYERADLIIAKGQGNYESLAGTAKNTFFLFTVKCPLIALAVGESVGTMVLKNVKNEEEG